MHHVRSYFVQRREQKGMESKQRQRKAKLERRNAVKDIDYDPSTSSSSQLGSSSFDLGTRSLDALSIGYQRSLRIEGTDGKFELICQSLGLSGPEDFEIPVDDWEVIRSSLDAPQTSQWSQFGGPEVGSSVLAAELSKLPGTFADSGRVGVVIDRRIESVESNTLCCGGFDELDSESLCRLDNNSTVQGLIANNTNSVGRGVLVEGGGGRTVGIKGIRPPVLATLPPCMSSMREEIFNSRIREAAAVSEGCSFTTTTSNDDDSSSTTTEPMSSLSPPNVRLKRTITSWQKGELLGRGSFGSVYEGIAEGGYFFAVKEVSLLDQGDRGKQSILQLGHEIALLSQFEHENIVQYYGTQKDEAKLYIFLELVKGSLLSLYQKYNLQDSQVSTYTRQILQGLKYLHDQGVVHRDIKCANILYDASGCIKLADFGLAKATKLNDVKSCKGTAFWMAPEVVNRRNQGYGLPADIWSLGCTVLEMLTRQLPYSQLECMQALFRIGKGVPPTVPDSLSRDARDFILKCLQVDPSVRPTAAQLLDHPFLKSPLSSSPGSLSPHNLGRNV